MLRLRMFSLRLDLEHVSQERMATAMDCLRRGRFVITTLAQERSRDADAIVRIYDVHNECRRCQPPVHVRETPIPYDRWYASFADEDLAQALPEGYLIASTGTEYAGVASVEKTVGQPGVLMCGFTGVRPQYRGLGVGLALKAATIQFARAKGYHALVTEVLEVNSTMLRINQQFGFREVGCREQAYPAAGAVPG